MLRKSEQRSAYAKGRRHLPARLEIAGRIREAIQRSGVSQNGVGRSMGVSSSTVAGWVSGRTQPSLEQFARLCRGLRVRADDVLGVFPDDAFRPDVRS